MDMYGNGQAPIFILKEGVQRTRGRSAQSNNIAAAKAVADAVLLLKIKIIQTGYNLINI